MAKDKQRVAWITGGARMGVAVAEALKRLGYRVVISFRRTRVQLDDPSVELLRCDVNRPADIQRAVKTIRKRFGRLDLLVHMASIYEKGNWEGHMATHPTSAFNTVVACAPLLRAQGDGRVVLFSDWT